jgi:hypothetical protein
MLNIKSLSSGIAAAALVSTIGLAYAQNSTGQSTSPTPSQTVQNAPGSQGTTGSSSSSTGMNNSTSGSGINAGSSMNPSTDPGFSTDSERQARGDRN